jgi:hypothetical protein
MKFLSSLDPKDRKLFLWFLGVAAVLAVAIGFLMPNGNNNENPLPSTYLSGQHGARAAYETLLRSGYSIQRWERPLSELAPQAGPGVVVIFAEPYTRDAEDIRAVRQILDRGGRVLATGFYGGYILPAGAPDSGSVHFAPCKLDPEGLDPLASTGEVWMVPEATWQPGNPRARVQYSCGNNPAVVEYDWSKGHVVWWAAATPLENGSLDRGNNLDLLLNSLGPPAGRRIYWDESLHGEIRSEWSYASGPSLTLLWAGLPLMGLLLVWSFSRRSGPVRDLPAPARATPIEFLEALGSLYGKAGASSTAVAIAWERFRRHALRLCGQRPARLSAAELAAAIRRRFPQADPKLEEDLAACEEATRGELTNPRQALKLVQTLNLHRQKLLQLARPGSAPAESPSSPQERSQ